MPTRPGLDNPERVWPTYPHELPCAVLESTNARIGAEPREIEQAGPAFPLNKWGAVVIENTPGL
jgi:hypothetical protein